MMKFILATMMTLVSTNAFAQSMCDMWVGKERYLSALKAVAAHQNYSLEQLCTLPHVMAVEVQPSRVITPKGEVIPHVRVELHSSEYSCMYMVRDADLEITSGRCYSTF